MKLIPHKKSAAAKTWIRDEAAAQQQRYLQISKYINETLAPARNKWIRAFLERIQTRGYNVHFNMLRKIKPEEIPKRPKRKFKVVF
jgi:hypothetical protein